MRTIDIKFIARDKPAYEAWPKPVLAAENKPGWYRQLHPYSGGKLNVISTNVNGRSSLNPTLKRCLPVQDLLTAGYHILLPCDIFIEADHASGGKKFVCPDQCPSMIAGSSTDQAGGYPVPDGYDPMTYQWNQAWIVKTPPGWSCLFQHPAWHDHLPFRNLPKMVETDRHHDVVAFPFFLERGFTGLVPKGTPIAQVLPIRRHHTKAVHSWDRDGGFNAKYHSFYLSLLNKYRNSVRQPKSYSIKEADESNCPFSRRE